MQDILEEMRHCVVDIEIGKAASLVKEALRIGVPPCEIFTSGLSKGMDLVGQKYEAGEYFLSELLGAAQVVKEAMEELSPHLQREQMEHIGTVVIGTVRGDIHDIGKNIVKMLLVPAGFKVHDLETDVPAEKFAEKTGETTADIVAMSSLLTTTMGEMKTNIHVLERSGLRKRVKIIVGGAPITDEFAEEIEADAAGRDAAHGVKTCKEWMRKA